MPYDARHHHRHSTRLKGYDYSQSGVYFVTICTDRRACLFGTLAGDQIILSDLGQIAEAEWLRTAVIRPEADTPIRAHSRAPLQIPPSGDVNRARRSLGSLIGGFKSAVTKRGNERREMPGTPLWQRGYYDQIIRSETMLNNMRLYIAMNPARWTYDLENPDR